MGKTLIINMLCGALPADAENVTFINILRQLNPAYAVARAALRRIHPGTIAFFEDYGRLDAELPGAETIIMFDYKGMLPLARRIGRLAPEARKIAYYWNSLGATPPAMPPGWELWTFDPSDALRHGMRYGGQFIVGTPALHRHTSGPVADVCFIGRDKGRFRTVRCLARQFARYGLTTDMAYVGPWPGQQKAMPYGDYLSRQSQARAIVEVNASGQRGLSLRTLEAMALQTKLISTNGALAGWRHYSPDRIMIVPAGGRHFAAHIRQWLHEPSSPWPSTDYYNFENWLGRMLAGTECNDFGQILNL